MSAAAFCQVCLDCLCKHTNRQTLTDQAATLFFCHHFDLQTLETSGLGGCPICRLLWTQLEHLKSKITWHGNGKVPLTYLLLQPSGTLKVEDAYELAAYINDDATTTDGIEQTSIVLFLLQRLNVVRDYYAARQASPNTGSQESWSLAIKWLESCLSEHSECSLPPRTAWYPTRLLDLGTHPTASAFRLITTSEEPPQGSYVTLSHRWGAAQNLKLTRSTHQHLKSGKSLQDLPLTFQHAVDVAKRLSKRYLWIDSLCIFQDEYDKSDWLKEAGLMDKVYSHSFLNIAATGAFDSSKGLFMTRDLSVELLPVYLSCPVSTTSTGTPSPVQDFIASDVMFLERELMDAPLNRRAWVLQERLLCPRVLHFGSTQLFWECRRGIRCERFPDRLPEFMAKLTSTTFKSFDITNVKQPLAANTELKEGNQRSLVIYHLWSRIVRAYSRTQLTFKNDKAIAVTGIAKAMRSVFQDEYVAGMWRRCLEAQLLWSVDGLQQVDHQRSTRDFSYRAPTWSWLSVDGNITPGRCLRKGLSIEVLDVSLQYLTSDTTGLITSGHLKLRGRLRPLKLRPLIFKNVDGTNRDLEMSGMWLMTVGTTDLHSTDKSLKPWEKIGTLVHLDLPHHDFDEDNKDGTLFIMSAGGPWDVSDDPFTGGDVDPFHDMLLLRCINRDRGIFHRFGLAQFSTTQKPDFWSIVQEYDAQEAGLPCVEYDGRSRKHTIIVE